MNTALSAIPAGSYWKAYNNDSTSPNVTGDIIGITILLGIVEVTAGVKFNGDSLDEDEIFVINSLFFEIGRTAIFNYIPFRWKSITFTGKAIIVFANDAN